MELLSFTVDPKRDSTKGFNEYAKSYNLNTNNWNLITGNQNTIYQLGVNGFLVPNQEDALGPRRISTFRKINFNRSKTKN